MREKARDTPGLIIDTTLYNNGRRLAVTALPEEAFDYGFFGIGRARLSSAGA